MNSHDLLRLAWQAIWFHRQRSLLTLLGVMLAAVLSKQGQMKAAETMLQQALAMQRRLTRDETLDTATTLGTLGSTFLSQGKLEEAKTTLREALAIQKKMP